MMFSWS